MKKKHLVWFITIIILFIVGIDFYLQNDSRKVEKTFRVRKSYNNPDSIDSAIDVIKSAKLISEFRLVYLSNLISKTKLNRYFNFIDYIFPKQFDNNDLQKFIYFFNDSTNFEIGETTFDEVDYVVRMYDSDNSIIFKMWIDFDCRMIDSEPKLTNIYGGYLTEKGLRELKTILTK